MNELDKLLEERKMLDRKIRLLKKVGSDAGQFETIRYSHKSDEEDGREWQAYICVTRTYKKYESSQVALKNGRNYSERKLVANPERAVWQSFIREKTREEAAKKIRLIIKDLNALLNVWDTEEVSK